MATDVVASRPPERRPTGMLHARAKSVPCPEIFENTHNGVGVWFGMPRSKTFLCKYLGPGWSVFQTDFCIETVHSIITNQTRQTTEEARVSIDQGLRGASPSGLCIGKLFCYPL